MQVTLLSFRHLWGPSEELVTVVLIGERLRTPTWLVGFSCLHTWFMSVYRRSFMRVLIAVLAQRNG